MELMSALRHSRNGPTMDWLRIKSVFKRRDVPMRQGRSTQTTQRLHVACAYWPKGNAVGRHILPRTGSNWTAHKLLALDLTI